MRTMKLTMEVKFITISFLKTNKVRIQSNVMGLSAKQPQHAVYDTRVYHCSNPSINRIHLNITNPKVELVTLANPSWVSILAICIRDGAYIYTTKQGD